MGYTGMCRCEGYGFQAVYSGIGYEWSPIRSVIKRVMRESDLFNRKYDYSPNWTTRNSVAS